VPVKTLIAEIGEPGEAPSTSQPAASDLAGATAAGGPGDLPPREASPGEVAIASAASGVSGGQTAPAKRPGAQRLFASPRARMRARVMGVDLGAIQGSGPRGRIVEADVVAAGGPLTRVLTTPLARRLAEEHGVSIAEVRGTGPGGRITQEDVQRAADQRVAIPQRPQGEAQPEIKPLTRIRRITAERMAASAQSTARVSLFLDADFSEVTRFRQQLQPEFARLGVPKLPWDAIIARAAALALTDHAAVLAQWADGGLRMPSSLDIGVAVALQPEGLVVPVLRDADRRSLRDLAGDLLALVEKARSGRLSPAEMQGSAFSITNLGAYRIDGFTPIINPPETAILGVGRIADKAVVIDGTLEARTMCTLSLSFDHRVVDGVPAAAFLARLAELLERPYALLGI
jgi:pyruvate dehydrogenase E2 component (dihydrolipoamide acetyltransferase)